MLSATQMCPELTLRRTRPVTNSGCYVTSRARSAPLRQLAFLDHVLARVAERLDADLKINRLTLVPKRR
jgi:hypothetical protein